MFHQNELESALGVSLDAINWQTKDFRPLPYSGRFLLLGADGTFREPKSEDDLTEYLLGGEYDEIQEPDDEEEEEDFYLWL